MTIIDLHQVRPIALDELVNHPKARDVLINDGRHVYIDLGEGLRLAGTTTEAQTRAFVERELRTSGRRIDRTSPIVDARLRDGSRLCAVIPPIAFRGTCVAVRRFTVPDVTIANFGGIDLEGLIAEIIDRRCNVIVTGAAGVGKTTFANAFCSLIDRHERIITIEDTAELSLSHPHVVSLESQPPNLEGNGSISVASLLRTALRMRPDRLIVGEVRGAEVLDMLAAMNTGHSGSLSTCHANSPMDAIRRLESLVLQHRAKWTPDGAREHIRPALDVGVHVTRLDDGTRVVESIVELPLSQHHVFVELYRHGERTGSLTRGMSK
ncbi:MAG: CpaF family protein [Ilumatobacteraceae bacterium]